MTSLGPAVARHDRDENAARLVRLVDREGVVRDDVGEGVGDALEHGRVRLLRQHLVEDVREPTVRVDDRVRARGRLLLVGRLDRLERRAFHRL